MTFPQPISFDEKMKEWDSVPLFMQSLPGPDEEVDDTAISALQSLAHEGTPDGGSECPFGGYRRRPLSIIQKLRRTSRSRATSTSRGNGIGRHSGFIARGSMQSPRMLSL